MERNDLEESPANLSCVSVGTPDRLRWSVISGAKLMIDIHWNLGAATLPRLGQEGLDTLCQLPVREVAY